VKSVLSVSSVYKILYAPKAKMALPRLDQPEWLDQGRGSDRDVAANLEEMWRINLRLGGLGALTRHLYPRVMAADGPVTLLDLGTGSAHVPLAIARWARSTGRPLRICGVDWAGRHLAVARRAVARRKVNGQAKVSLLQADASRLPVAPSGVDFVVSSLFLHHFAPGPAIDLLRSASAIARRSLIMSDLVRGRLPWLAFKLLQPIFARQALTRHDGALSIRRAYTPAELRELAAAAGLRGARVYEHWPWRMTLVADRGPDA
jgi:SAM-dependent methyltransferase